MWSGGSGISWTIRKSFAPRSRQITTPEPHHSVLYRPDALSGAQPTIFKLHEIFCICFLWPWRQCSTLCTSGFVDDVMFSHSWQILIHAVGKLITIWLARWRTLEESVLSSIALLWSALWNRADHHIFMLWFVLLVLLLLLLLSFFSSPNLSRHRLDVCHTSTHGVTLVRI